MALFHRATLVPSKAELIAEWLPRQPWGPPAGTPVEVVGAFRFDDPEGQVGMETFLVTAGDDLYQVPLTYRNEPLADGDDGFVGQIEHSALGTRWVYDGLHDPRYVMVLTAVAMTGQGQAIGFVEVDGRWAMAPTAIQLEGGGWGDHRMLIDGFEADCLDEPTVTLRSDGLELTVWRRPMACADRPSMGLTAAGPGLDAAVLLAAVTPRS